MRAKEHRSIIRRWVLSVKGSLSQVILLIIGGLIPAAGAMAGELSSRNLPPGSKFVLVSSFQCFASPCEFENAVLRYDALTGSFLGVHIAKINGPYGMALHPFRGTLLVVSRSDEVINEYNARTGALIGTFITAGAEGLHAPQNLVFTPSGDVLVTSTQSAGHFDKFNGLLQFDGTNGTFVRPFVDGGLILTDTCNDPRCLRGAGGLAYGQNGHLYVASMLNSLVLEYDGDTGAYIDFFEAFPYLQFPEGLIVRPPGTPREGNILVTSKFRIPGDPNDLDKILELDPATHTLMAAGGVFANGMESPGPMAWHESGNLLVGDRLLWNQPPNYSDKILERQQSTGALVDSFTPAGDNHLRFATGILPIAFGFATADKDGDGDTDLADLGMFQRCMGRPPIAGCLGPFDDNLSGTIDLVDFQALRALFTGPPRSCVNNSECDDANACTQDLCTAGACTHSFLAEGTACPDGRFCTGPDVCLAGLCRHSLPCTNLAHCDEATDRCLACLNNAECEDGNPCTTDACTPNGCSHISNTAVCNDGNACTTNDHCLGGQCIGGPPPNCNDGNLCTEDDCDSDIGCLHRQVFIPCDDGSVCTTDDICLFGRCRGGAPLDCDDQNPCTDDSCHPTFGCSSTINHRPCEDGNGCTLSDTCVNGSCVPGPINCDDEIPCTVDACIDQICAHQPDSAVCDNHMFCDGVEICDAAVGCKPGPLPCCEPNTNPCVPAACNETADRCGN